MDQETREDGVVTMNSATPGEMPTREMNSVMPGPGTREGTGPSGEMPAREMNALRSDASGLPSDRENEKLAAYLRTTGLKDEMPTSGTTATREGGETSASGSSREGKKLAAYLR